MNFKYRTYQEEIISKGTAVLARHGFLYLTMEVRTGKTLTSLGICDNISIRNILFITKKKAISSIEHDYALLPHKYKLTVINYESLHKVSHETRWDVIIIDESHSLGAFPKKNKRCKDIQMLTLIYKPKVILLSGTPTPESYSQMFHQVCFIPGNPFAIYKNFYQFARKYVKVRQRKINSLFINDFSDGSPQILEDMKPYTLSFTQKEAGFEVDTNEEILYVTINQQVSSLIKRLTKDRVIEGKEEVVLADTPVKLMTKVHQMCSGTVKFESGRSKVLDKTKALYIKAKFKDKKIAIFYKFKAELKALKEIFEDSLCETLDEFNTTNKNIALQILSGREGISLAQAEALIYYNIDFSATSYWQSRDRMTTKSRLYNKIYWIFSKGGIEDDIYKAVIKKKDYTLNHFKRDLLTL